MHLLANLLHIKVIYTTPHYQIVVVPQIPTLETAVKLNGRITVLALALVQELIEFLKSETLGFEFNILTPISIPTNGSVT